MSERLLKTSTYSSALHLNALLNKHTNNNTRTVAGGPAEEENLSYRQDDRGLAVHLHRADHTRLPEVQLRVRSLASHETREAQHDRFGQPSTRHWTAPG